MKLRAVRFKEHVYSPGKGTGLHVTYRTTGGPGLREEQVGGPVEQVMKSIDVVDGWVVLTTPKGEQKLTRVENILDAERLEKGAKE